MSTSKKTGQSVTKQEPPAPRGFFSSIRWGESYVSLIFGAIVVIVAAALGLFYVKFQQPKGEILPPAQISRVIKATVSPSPSISAQQATGNAITISPTPAPIQTTAKNQKQKTYIVQKNDDLWNIAMKEYGSGYSWVSIAEANHLANPGRIYTGDALIIPSVTPILVQNNTKIQQVTPRPVLKYISPSVAVTPTPATSIVGNGITAGAYTVQKGDTLWSIAVRAYGDGYKWVNIAKANKLVNPGVIHAGNILNIPRPQTL